jgi:hypothetical protein
VLFGGHGCPQAMSLYEEVVNLNNDFHITERQAERLAAIVRDHVVGTARPRGNEQ